MTHRPGRRALVTLAAVALALGACSSDDDADASTPTTAAETSGDTATSAAAGETAPGSTEGGGGGVDLTGVLCDLVPLEQAEAILGQPLRIADGTTEGCTWDEAEGEASAVATLAYEPGGEAQFDSDRDTPIAGSENVDVEGIGDRAFYDTGFELLRVLTDGEILNVSVTDPAVADKQAAAVAIAEVAIANL